MEDENVAKIYELQQWNYTAVNNSVDNDQQTPLPGDTVDGGWEGRRQASRSHRTISG